jgi:hypothetical protein
MRIQERIRHRFANTLQTDDDDFPARVEVLATRDGLLTDELPHLVVCRLVEALIPQADRLKRLRRDSAHDLVGFAAQSLARFHCADRNRDNEARWFQSAKGDYRGLHRRARRQAVVDDEDDAAANLWTRTPLTIERIAAIELEAFPYGDLLNSGMGNVEIPNQVIAEDFHATFGDGAHCQLGVPRHTKLADEEDVERRRELARDLGRDRHAAARQREHDNVLSARILRKLPCELAACVDPICELHDVCSTRR